LLAETLSMNAVMAGMIPVMVILMSRDMSAMEPSSVRFWGTMSLAFVVGTVTTYPVNWWLVKRGLKHGMGGEARARLGHSVSAASKLAATFLTLAMLAGGVALAARYGGFLMRAGGRMEMGADSGYRWTSLRTRLATERFIVTSFITWKWECSASCQSLKKREEPHRETLLLHHYNFRHRRGQPAWPFRFFA
jgi:Domain of unknown function (DUF4396)